MFEYRPLTIMGIVASMLSKFPGRRKPPITVRRPGSAGSQGVFLNLRIQRAPTAFLFACLCLAASAAALQAATGVVFTNPYGGGDTAARTQMIQFINSATASIDVAIYTFTYERSGSTLGGIAEALQSARARGVNVRVVTDEDEVSSTSSTQFVILDILDGAKNGSINPSVIRSGNGTGIMHNKFIVADGNRVLTGSTNWTQSGLFYQENNVLVLEGASVAGVYRAKFEELWGGTYGNDGEPGAEHSFVTSDGVPVEVWFGSDDDLTGRIIDAIDSATSRLYFAMNVFSTGAKAVLIANALKAAAARGVDVRGVMDDDVDQWGYLVSTPAIPMGDYIPATSGLLHSKYMVVDPGLPQGKVLTGSNNWSTNADVSNDENLAILASPEIVNRYFHNFRVLYVERSANAGGSLPVRRFGDLTGDNHITQADYDAARAIASNQRAATAFELITGDVAPEPGTSGHTFGDGAIDAQDVAWLANYLGIPQGTDTVGAILDLPDGSPVETEALVVTAVFGSTFYVGQADRAAGIRVQGASVAVGDEVTISGSMSTLATAERYIAASSVVKLASGRTPPAAVGVQQIQMCGQDRSPWTRGVPGAITLYNVGLRETIHGRVTGWGLFAFWVDDGSGCDDGSGFPGVKVACGTLARPEIGALVRVTGVSSLDLRNGAPVRLLRTAIQSEIEALE